MDSASQDGGFGREGGRQVVVALLRKVKRAIKNAFGPDRLNSF